MHSEFPGKLTSHLGPRKTSERAQQALATALPTSDKPQPSIAKTSAALRIGNGLELNDGLLRSVRRGLTIAWGFQGVAELDPSFNTFLGE